MRTNFIIMDMPESLKIALLVDNDGLIDHKTLLVLRNQAWRIVAGMGFFEEDEYADTYPRA